MKMTKIH